MLQGLTQNIMVEWDEYYTPHTALVPFNLMFHYELNYLNNF